MLNLIKRVLWDQGNAVADQSVYEEMKNADSIGSYYNQNIKGVYASAEQH